MKQHFMPLDPVQPLGLAIDVKTVHFVAANIQTVCPLLFAVCLHPLPVPPLEEPWDLIIVPSLTSCPCGHEQLSGPKFVSTSIVLTASRGELRASVFSKHCSKCSTTHHLSYSAKVNSTLRAFRCDCLDQPYFCPQGRVVWETTYLRAVTNRLYRGFSFHAEWSSWNDTFLNSKGIDDHTFANHWFIWALVKLTLSLSDKRRGCVYNTAGPVISHPTATEPGV
jgi:hypothetical protein